MRNRSALHRHLIAKFIVVTFCCWPFEIQFCAAQTTLDDALKACQRGQEQIPSTTLDANSFERQLQNLMRQKLEDCTEAEHLIGKYEEEISVLKVTLEKLTPDALFESTRSAEALVDSELAQLLLQVRRLRAVPNEPTQSNNEQLQDIDDQRNRVRDNASSLEEHWDAIHVAATGGPIADLQKLAESTLLEESVRDQIRKYLDSVPPYLLARGPAPRAALNFLKRQIAQSSRAAANKNWQYTYGIRRELAEALESNLGQDALVAKAKAIHELLDQRMGRETVAWASVAMNQGACGLASDTMREQLNLIKNVVGAASPELRPFIAKELESEKEQREQIIVISCVPNLARLGQFINANESLLRFSCAKSTVVNRNDSDALVRDLQLWQGQATSPRTDDEQNAFLVLGEELWMAAQSQTARCRRPS